MGESNGDVVRRLSHFFLLEKGLDVKVRHIVHSAHISASRRGSAHRLQRDLNLLALAIAQYGDGNYVHTGT